MALNARVSRSHPDTGCRGDDFLGAHPLEPVVPGVERADVIEAEPAVVAGAVEAGPAFAGRAKFARLFATWRGARAVAASDAAVELVEPHGFHMGIEALEGKI